MAKRRVSFTGANMSNDTTSAADAHASATLPTASKRISGELLAQTTQRPTPGSSGCVSERRSKSDDQSRPIGQAVWRGSLKSCGKLSLKTPKARPLPSSSARRHSESQPTTIRLNRLASYSTPVTLTAQSGCVLMECLRSLEFARRTKSKPCSTITSTHLL